MAAAVNIEPNLAVNTNELCQKRCVSHIYDDDDNKFDCNNPLTSPDNFDNDCRTLKDNNKVFYETIGDANWNNHVRHILENFIRNDINTHRIVINAMLSVIFPTDQRKMYKRFNHFENDNYHKCHDMICEYGTFISTGNVRRLFHISLHPSTPLYIQGQTRAAYTCGAYPNQGDETGPFHYKIDHITGIDDKIPYSQLEALPTGHFTPHGRPFKYTLQPGFDESTAMFHEYMYLRFIKYWNRCITYLNSNRNIANAPWSNTIPVIQNDDYVEMRQDINDAAKRCTFTERMTTQQKMDSIPVYHAVLEVIRSLEQQERNSQRNVAAPPQPAALPEQQPPATKTLSKAAKALQNEMIQRGIVVSHQKDTVVDKLAIATEAVSSAISATQAAVSELATASAAISSASITASPAASAKKVGKNAKKTQKKKQNQQSLNNGSASAASLPSQPRLNSLDNFILDYMTQGHRVPASIKSEDQFQAFLIQKYEEAKALEQTANEFEQAKKASQQAMARLLNEEAKQSAKQAAKQAAKKQNAISEEQNDPNSNGLMPAVLGKSEHQTAKKQAKKQAKKKGKRGGSTRKRCVYDQRTRKRRTHHRPTRKRRVYRRRTHKK